MNTPWILHGYSMELHGRSMEFHGFPWHSVEVFHTGSVPVKLVAMEVSARDMAAMALVDAVACAVHL